MGLAGLDWCWLAPLGAAQRLGRAGTKRASLSPSLSGTHTHLVLRAICHHKLVCHLRGDPKGDKILIASAHLPDTKRIDIYRAALGSLMNSLARFETQVGRNMFLGVDANVSVDMLPTTLLGPERKGN